MKLLQKRSDVLSPLTCTSACVVDQAVNQAVDQRRAHSTGQCLASPLQHTAVLSAFSSLSALPTLCLTVGLTRMNQFVDYR